MIAIKMAAAKTISATSHRGLTDDPENIKARLVSDTEITADASGKAIDVEKFILKRTRFLKRRKESVKLKSSINIMTSA